MRNSEKCFVFNYSAGYYKDAWFRKDSNQVYQC